jgi:hypothetical protein
LWIFDRFLGKSCVDFSPSGTSSPVPNHTNRQQLRLDTQAPGDEQAPATTRRHQTPENRLLATTKHLKIGSWLPPNKLGLKEEQQIEKTRKIEKEVIAERATRYARTGAI